MKKIRSHVKRVKLTKEQWDEFWGSASQLSVMSNLQNIPQPVLIDDPVQSKWNDSDDLIEQIHSQLFRGLKV